MDFHTRQAIAALVQQLTDLQERVRRSERAQATPQLPNSSLTNGAIKAIDSDGTHRGSIGFQDDGTFATTAVNGPPPPAPSVPVVEAGQLSLTITWDGVFAGGAEQPADFDHVQVHLSTSSGFIPGASTLRGSLRKPGALVCSPLQDSTTYYVVLVGVNTSGVAGDASGEVLGVPDAVVATDVIDGIITTVKLADDAVTEAKIAAAAVGTTEIADDAVTTPKVVAGAIQAAQIAAGAVNAGALAAGAVTTEKLDALAVTSDKIAANAITAGKLDAGAVTAATIAAGAIDGQTITGATIIADSATGGVFLYSGTPARGNLIASIAAMAGTDAYGNAYGPGIVSSGGGALTTFLAHGAFSFSDPTFAGPSPGVRVTIDTTPAGTPVLSVSSPSNNQTSQGYSTIRMFGQSADGSGAPLIYIAGVSNGGADTPVPVQINGPVYATKPNSLSIQETWHPMTLQSGWANNSGTNEPASYRLVASPAKCLQIVGSIIGGTTAAGGVTIAQLPAGYYSTTRTLHFHLTPFGVAPAAGLEGFVTTGGAVTITATTGATRLDFNAILPLDL